MEEKQAGITALITAYARAYHVTHDTPIIFDDFLADQFYTPEEHLSFDHNLAGLVALIDPDLAARNPTQAQALAAVMQLHNGPITLSRSRFAEDCLEAAVQAGVRQFLILGAGFDTFAFRRPDLRLRVFEVDHPATQALKRERIRQAGWEIPASLSFIPLDFAHGSLAEALSGSAYDPAQPAFASWLGVTYYLEQNVIDGTLASIAALLAPGSRLAFDYLDLDAFDPDKAPGRIQLLQAIARQVGEPMKTGFDPQHLATHLLTLGYRLEDNLSPAEIQTLYFKDRRDRYRAFEHVYFACAWRD